MGEQITEAWAAWCSSEQGERCLAYPSLTGGEFLKNRLWWAFMAGAEVRNRELTERLEAAERLVENWRNVETTNRTSQIVYGWAAEELEQAIAPAAPVKPVAGEET